MLLFCQYGTNTTSLGQNNLINNVCNQYRQRTQMFNGMNIDFWIDVYGQEYTNEIIQYITNSIENELGVSNIVHFYFE